MRAVFGVFIPDFVVTYCFGKSPFLINILHKSFEMLIFVLQLPVVSFWLLD